MDNANLTAPGRILSNNELEEVRAKLVDIVMDTFRLRPMPSGNITERECQDRLDVTVEIWNHLYGVCRWSREKCLDHIKPLLVACIDGANVQDRLPEPAPQDKQRDGSTMWAPEQLDKIEAERRLSALAVGEGAVIQLGGNVTPCGDKDDSGGQS